MEISDTHTHRQILTQAAYLLGLWLWLLNPSVLSGRCLTFSPSRNRYGLIGKTVGQLSRGTGGEKGSEEGKVEKEDEKTETQTRL